jgi:quercetin dioxygenase-like cupin family protein
MLKKINWDDVPVEQVTDKMQRKMIYGDKVMVAIMKFKDGFLVPLHDHVNEQVTQVVSGTIRFWFGANKEQTMDLGPGDSVVIPAHVPHEALMLGDVVGLKIFNTYIFRRQNNFNNWSFQRYWRRHC